MENCFWRGEAARGAAAAGGSGPRPSLQDPAQTVAWGGRLPSRRRVLTGGLSGLVIVLASDFLGSTGALLSLDGGRLAGRLRLDVLYPVRGLKRCVDAQNGFEFQYPAAWLADQRMAQRNAARQEQAVGLDLPAARERRRGVAEPVAAFGPPGSSGELNVSVIVAPIQPGFSLRGLGDPREAGERFLASTIAPPGSGVTAALVAASERSDEAGQLYYILEYTVERADRFSRHNVSAITARGGQLFTLNGQSPQSSWQQNADALRTAAESFQVSGSALRPRS